MCENATILEISIVSYKNIAFAQMSDYPLKIYSSTEPSVLQSQGNKGWQRASLSVNISVEWVGLTAILYAPLTFVGI